MHASYGVSTIRCLDRLSQQRAPHGQNAAYAAFCVRHPREHGAHELRSNSSCNMSRVRHSPHM